MLLVWFAALVFDVMQGDQGCVWSPELLLRSTACILLDSMFRANNVEWKGPEGESRLVHAIR